MSNEIKVKFASVEKVLLDTQTASQNINTKFPAPVKGNNDLASLDTCEFVIKELSNELLKYTEVLYVHINKTQLMIEQFRQEDENIASGIKKGVDI